MTDIVERLRALAAIDGCQASIDAADEIPRLRAENERLREEAEFCYMTGFDVAKNQYCTMVQGLEDENERLRAALRAAFDAGSELGWDHATYSERGGPEPIGHEDAFAAFLAALDGQPAQPRKKAA